RGILPPADVDPRSGYRIYTGAQLRAATTIRALRAAGMPLESVAQVLREPDRGADLVGAYEDRLHAERAMEDRAIGSSRRILVDPDAAQVQARQVGATHWVALTTIVGTDDDGAEDPRWANSLVESLHTALSRAGNPPTGHWWTDLEPTDSA